MPSPPYIDFAANHGPTVLRSPTCAYHDFTTIWDADLFNELAPQPPPQCDFGANLAEYADRIALFDGWAATRWTAAHWEIPLVAVAVYLLMIACLKAWMGPRNGGRKPIKATRVVLLWNFGLSAFSVAGMVYTVPLLLWGPSGVLNKGWYASVCNNAGEYGHGMPGLFVALFIYSKLAELLDTFFLLIRKSPVIFLHWWAWQPLAWVHRSLLLCPHQPRDAPRPPRTPRNPFLAGTTTQPSCSSAGTPTRRALARASGMLQ